jgi:hypothetical protein
MTKALPMLLLLAATGCAQLHALNLLGPSDYDKTLASARQAVDAGNYFVADKLLDEFARTHPGTPEAREIAFWRAAYTLDPANSQGSLRDGITALDGYLAASPTGQYRTEAMVLRRTAAVAQNLNTPRVVVDTATTVVRDTVVVGSKSRDEQIAALRDQLEKSKAELAKVSAELDRIKKRLANPSN